MSLRPEQLATALRSLVIKRAVDGLDGEEQLELEAALDLLLDQPTSTEHDVVAQVLDEVYEVPEAGDIFLSELEIQSELVFLGKRHDQAALLMCLPVIFMAGDQPQRLAMSTDQMEELCHVLTETDVVGSQAQVSLLPRLFRPEELVTQSYGTLRALTVSLGEQVLQGDAVRLERGLIAEGMAASEKFAWGDNPYVELRYLVGVVVTHESALDDVFPAVGPESTDADMYRLKAQVAADEQEAANAEEGAEDEGEASDEPDGSRLVVPDDDIPAPFEGQAAPGEAPDGTYWEDVFLEVVDEVFMPMFGAQATLLPDDFHENLRRGLELWRQSGLQHQVGEGFDDEEAVVLHAKPYTDEATGRMGWDLVLMGEDGTIRDQAPWEVLLHEDPESSEEALRSLCESAGWTLASVDPLLPSH